MKILLDADAPAKLRKPLAGHEVITAQEMGWGLLRNGDLLTAAEALGFDLLLTGDKNLAYQQNLQGRKLALIVLGTQSWKKLREDLGPVVEAVNRASPGSYEELPAIGLSPDRGRGLSR